MRLAQGARHAEQEKDEGSLLNFYRSLIAWRKQHPVLIDGDARFLRLPEPLLGFRRTGEDGQSLLCLFNLSPEARVLKVSGTLNGLEPVSNAASLDGKTLALGPNGYAFIAEAGNKPARVRVAD